MIIIFKMIMKLIAIWKSLRVMKIEMVIYEVNKWVGNPYLRSYLNYFGE